MKAALYIRVSTDDQATNGVSLDAQEERLKAYCVARDWEIGEVYRDEGQSAKTMDRPALQRLLADTKAKKYQAILVFKLDRLTRSVHDLGTLLNMFNKRDLALVSLTESLDASTAAGRLMMNLLGSVSQWEREAIGERTAMALRHKRNHLQAYNHPPYGFVRAGDDLKPVDAELKVVRLIHKQRARGDSYRAIAGYLNDRRLPTKLGRKWAAEQIRLVLRNPIYERFVDVTRRVPN